MSSGSGLRPLAAALALPLALFAAFASQSGLLRCQMDGIVRGACCCPHKTSAAATTPALERDGCCEALSFEAEALPTLERRASHSAQPVLVAMPAPGTRFEAPWRRRPPATPFVEADERDAAGPPLFLLHRALLI
jgi:hypothetical protein